MNTLRVQRLSSAAQLPRRATDGAACYDLFAADNGTPHPGDPFATIYRTGLAVEVPPGWAMLVFSRSGHAFRYAARLSNSVGVIDSDYRGDVMVALRADGPQMVWPRAGDRVAQMMLVAAPPLEIVETDQLARTLRGSAGFGSTGA